MPGAWGVHARAARRQGRAGQGLQLCTLSEPGARGPLSAAMLASWVLAQSPDARIGLGRRQIPAEALFPPEVRKALALRSAANVDAPKDSDSARTWKKEFGKEISGKIIGAVVWRLEYWEDVMRVLEPHSKCVRDYFLSSRYHDCPLAYLAVVDYLLLDDPVVAAMTMSTTKLSKLFGKCPAYEASELVEMQCVRKSGQRSSVRAALDSWAADFGRRVFDRDGLCLVSLVPTPYAVLMCHGSFDRWALPVVQRSHWGHVGLPAVSSLVGDFQHATKAMGDRSRLHDPSADQIPGSSLVYQFEHIADTIRRLAGPAVDQRVADKEARDVVVWLQRRRDEKVFDAMRLSKRAFEFSHILSAVIASGMLKKASSLKPVVKAVGRLITDDPSMGQWIDDQLANKKIVSRSAIYRSRMSLHLCWCCVERDRNERMLLSPGGICVWRTVDSSPQHGYDWLLNGYRIVEVSQLQEAWGAAQCLCDAAASQSAKEAGSREGNGIGKMGKGDRCTIPCVSTCVVGHGSCAF